ncbi:MAG: NAD(P)H-hydrate epimerase [Lachnospiraceae bacterium]|nr:NAD(P)H-hydrate epimerase [Lachnospiraceae bacterium]
MERIVNAAQMKAIDAFSIQEIGIPSLVLMERAAMAVTDCAEGYLKGACGASEGGAAGSCGVRRECKAGAGKEAYVPRAAAVCGYGNNGGDGIAAARMLAHRGWNAEIWMVGAKERATKEVRAQLAIAQKVGILVREFGNDTEFAAYTVIIDALFGIGLARPIRNEYALAVRRMNESGAKVVSVDIASGICADNGAILGEAVRADATVTFGYRKPGHLLYPGAEYSGEVMTADIGFPKMAQEAVIAGRYPETEKGAGAPERFPEAAKEKEMLRIAAYTPEDLALLPARYPYSNKGSYGKVLICAGTRQMSGAAYLSAAAAYHMGAGLVRILTVTENYPVLAGLLPEALITCYDAEKLEKREDETVSLIRSALNWAGTVVLGPGIGRSGAAGNLVDIVVSELKKAESEEPAGKSGNAENAKKAGDAVGSGKEKVCVVDADALNLLAERLDGEERKDVAFRMERLAEYLPKNAILTPHLLELSRLTGIPVAQIAADLIDTADKCTYNNELVYVIKDARTITAKGKERVINVSGCEGMATGGSGDVLTGIIAGLAAGGLAPYQAAGLGVYIHGLAGMAAAKELSGRYMLAGDIIRYLPKIV